jgi:Fe-S cluster assembly ATPase SufC
MCVLNLLLLQSASPLLIDQVEEGLDNQYIYDVLVKALRRTKKDRQMILVTHNACIPVLANADRVFVHEVSQGQGIVRALGTVDEMRAWLERILDGGREAFRRRGERYGHFPSAGGPRDDRDEDEENDS